MSEPLGLSVDTSVLVALRAGRAPVSCESVPARPGRPEPEMGALADALDGLAEAAGYGSPVVVAVPAYWTPTTIDALRTALIAKPRLASRGMPPTLVTDVAAATTALSADSALPTDGILALCDVDGAASITLINAGAGFAPISGTVRHTGPLTGVADTVTATLTRDGVPPARLSAVVLTGTDAADPTLGAQLSQRLQVRVITADQPACTAAAGALLMAGGRLPDLNVSTPSVIATPALATRPPEAAPTGPDRRPHPAPAPVPRTAPAAKTPSAWYRRPVVLLVLAAALALAITGGLAYTMSGSRGPSGPAGTTVEPTGEPTGGR